MDLEAFGELVDGLPGVRRTAGSGRARWQVGGRLLARELDPTRVVVRVPFEVRDLLLRQAPRVFSVPSRLARHMSVVVDLAAGDEGAEGAVEDAVRSAWRLQTGDDAD